MGLHRLCEPAPRPTHQPRVHREFPFQYVSLLAIPVRRLVEKGRSLWLFEPSEGLVRKDRYAALAR